jgi:type I restriction enzyme R subunit
MNESETRADHIDPALRDAGWGVVDGSRILREYAISPGRIEGQGRRAKPLIADYVLVHRNRARSVAGHPANVRRSPARNAAGGLASASKRQK